MQAWTQTWGAQHDHAKTPGREKKHRVGLPLTRPVCVAHGTARTTNVNEDITDHSYICTCTRNETHGIVTAKRSEVDSRGRRRFAPAVKNKNERPWMDSNSAPM